MIFWHTFRLCCQLIIRFSPFLFKYYCRVKKVVYLKLCFFS